jgi:DNA-binding NtrC family response regulator
MSESLPITHERPLIVVVEDNESTNQILTDWLRLTYRVRSFFDAESMHPSAFTDDVPSAFVLDYKLPGKSGLVLQQELQSPFPDAKFILISGVFDEELTQLAQGSGFHALLAKPFNPAALSKKLQNLIGYPPSQDLTSFIH